MTMPPATPTPALLRENANLRALIEATGHHVADLWPTPEADPRVEHMRLRDLLRWVRAYQATPDRKALERQGLLYPPVEICMDPDSDWTQFTRWMAGLPLTWRYVETFGPLPEAEGLSDAELDRELTTLRERLAARGIEVDLQEGLPPRIAYRCLKADVEREPFEHLAPGTTCHLTACTSYCPECLQRPWCENGLEEDWPEDEDAGHKVCPEEVRGAMKG